LKISHTLIGVLLFPVLGLVACGGGTSSSSNLPATGFAVPSKISAVPTNGSGSSSGVVLSEKGTLSNSADPLAKLFGIKAATDPGTDYSNATTVKYVSEHSLDQFQTVETVLKALEQTHYADTANIGSGPYKAMVAWQDTSNGSAIKTLQAWVVESSMTTENGAPMNVVDVWAEQPQGTVRAQFKISKSATKNADGSYKDYGVWTLNAKLDATGSNYFVGSASIGASGEAILKIHEVSNQGSGTTETKGILDRSANSGFGKVQSPDFSSCNSPNCTPTEITTTYAYNSADLAIQMGSDPLVYKDRTRVFDMVNQYGMFDGVTGQDVTKSKSFGFPVQYTDPTTKLPQFAYYGSWQGRHQLWSNGSTVPQGTVVTRQDLGPNQSVSYRVSPSFAGALVKRTLVASDISNLLNLPVQTWVNINYNLFYDGTQWVNCTNVNFTVNPPVCSAGTPFTNFSSLVYNANDTQRFVNISKPSISGPPSFLVYLASTNPSATSGAGFYNATQSPSGGAPTIGSIYNPSNGDSIWANVGGSIYIEYTGVTSATATGWVQKTVTSFDSTTFTPTFDPNGDQQYSLTPNLGYYINNQGANFVVTQTAAGSPPTYLVQIELQSVANPVNVGTFVPAGTIFMPDWATWGDTTVSTYTFDTTAADSNYLNLLYRTVGNNDTNLNNSAGKPVSPGDVVITGQFGLAAYNASGTKLGLVFDWDYSQPGQNGMSITYLIDSNSTYKLLDDPITLNPISLTNNGGVSQTLSLQFDGWMHGLPDLFQELQNNQFVMTTDISNKIIEIPAGTRVTDAANPAQTYLIKPLDIQEFLVQIANPGNLDLSTASQADLSTVPVFVDANLGAEPSATTVKYSEGNLIP